MLSKMQARLAMISAVAMTAFWASNPTNFQRTDMSQVEAVSYLQSEIAFQDEIYHSCGKSEI